MHHSPYPPEPFPGTWTSRALWSLSDRLWSVAEDRPRVRRLATLTSGLAADVEDIYSA